MTHLVICEGDDGIPLWEIAPIITNITHNNILFFLEPYEICILLTEMNDGTCLLAHNGIIAFAVTECLTKIT